MKEKSMSDLLEGMFKSIQQTEQSSDVETLTLQVVEAKRNSIDLPNQTGPIVLTPQTDEGEEVRSS